MPEPRLIIVAGVGRCGTSLVMQCLEAAGVRCVGEWPDFEDERGNPARDNLQWIHAEPDGAVKLIDLQQFTMWPQKFGGRVPVYIVPQRDPVQQAKSQLKLMWSMGLRVPFDNKTILDMARGCLADTATLIKRAEQRGAKVAVFKFEALIERPAETLAWLAETIGVPALAGTAQVVRPRSTGCLPFMLEEQMLEERERADRENANG